jgi:phosphatidylserine/phosphatidylglycerophosphate/cardiolipin synthase-like enzyme
MAETLQSAQPVPLSPELGERLGEKPFTLQSPQEFRDDFVASASLATEQVGLETMQFEVCEDTQPIYDTITQAKERGVEDVRFHYDRVALRHLRVGEDQAFVFLGRTVLHRGDKAALKQANTERVQLVNSLESQQITDPSNRKRGQNNHMSHNHVKLAIVDDTAWFGTMNFRAMDFDISNFMVKVTDPHWVDKLKEVFEQTEATDPQEDKVFTKYDEADREETVLLLDAGAKDKSVIYEKALQMADSLREGDEFVMISQWPPIKTVYGAFAEKLSEKTKAGARGTYLMSPEDRLHPSRRASRMLQTQVKKMEQLDPNMKAVNLARMTHAKAFMIKRANGEQEVLFGSHNLTSWTVHNGTRELAMWSKDPMIVGQIASFLESVQSE